jgi:AraC-like DNA-binding protein
MVVHTALMGHIWQVLESYGEDPAAVIPKSMFRPGDYLAEGSFVRLESYEKVIVAALERIDDEAVGIRAGKLMHPSYLGIFGYAWLASPSLAASLEMLQRYCRAFRKNLDISIEYTANFVEASYRSHMPQPYAAIDLDTQLAGLVHLCRLQSDPDFVPASVSLERQCPVDRKPWDDYFGVPVRFGAKVNSVVIENSVANRILSTAHLGIFDQHQEKLEQTIAKLNLADIVGQVRVVIQQLLPSGSITEHEVARILGKATSSLYRALRQQGTTFRELLREVRMDLARRYVADPRYSITEVAFMLGYAETSAFSRAFRKWFGKSPTSARDYLLRDAAE